VADDLSAPLGQDTTKKKRFTLPLALPKAVAAALGLFIATFLIWATVVDDPLGGQPVAVVSVDIAGPAGKKPAAPADPGAKAGEGSAANPASAAPTPAVSDAGRNPAGLQTVTVIDGTSGKRQEVAVPAAEQAKLPPSIDPHLLETSRHGPIPRIGPDGARPLQVYARPVALAEQHPTIPRIAIVLTGLGIGSNTTAEALAKVPAPVTLAFSPYGIDIDRVVTRARGEGHEVLLMVPMEPFDYPDNDPGPQTLLTSLAPEQNIDRLQWLMSRFQGYVGLTNYMGARFTATDQSFAPVLREAAKRGLLYFDDGSSPRSLAGQLAGANNLPFAKADLVLDSVPTPEEIDGAFAKLEAIARERGSAVGVLSALPVSVARLSKWAKGIEGRGFVLVPITAAATKPKSS
jgi:polysaccharide deacetylase 2 family uncharacterized protein YibQ